MNKKNIFIVIFALIFVAGLILATSNDVSAATKTIKFKEYGFTKTSIGHGDYIGTYNGKSSYSKTPMCSIGLYSKGSLDPKYYDAKKIKIQYIDGKSKVYKFPYDQTGITIHLDDENPYKVTVWYYKARIWRPQEPTEFKAFGNKYRLVSYVKGNYNQHKATLYHIDYNYDNTGYATMFVVKDTPKYTFTVKQIGKSTYPYKYQLITKINNKVILKKNYKGRSTNIAYRGFNDAREYFLKNEKMRLKDDR